MEENNLTMRCKQCGELNRLPGVHCKKCGARLDFDEAEKRILKASGQTWACPLCMVAKLALAAALALILILTLWPGKMTRATGEELDAKRYRMKGELLIDALNRGIPASQVIEEKEINAHLRELLAAQPPAKGWSASLQDIGARFFDGRAEVFVAIGRGPLTFSAHFVAKPQDGKLQVTAAKAGHLPLPGVFGRLYGRTQVGLFRQMKNESRIVRNLDGAVVKNESIELLIKAGD